MSKNDENVTKEVLQHKGADVLLDSIGVPREMLEDIAKLDIACQSFTIDRVVVTKEKHLFSLDGTGYISQDSYNAGVERYLNANDLFPIYVSKRSKSSRIGFRYETNSLHCWIRVSEKD